MNMLILSTPFCELGEQEVFPAADKPIYVLGNTH